MATSENTLASPKGSSGTPDLKHDVPNTPDTEMTVPRTSTDDEDSMPSSKAFQSSNQRNARMRSASRADVKENGPGSDGGRPATTFNPPGPWRRMEQSAAPQNTAPTFTAPPSYAVGPSPPNFAATAASTPSQQPYMPQNMAGDSSFGGPYQPAAQNFNSAANSVVTSAIQPFPPYNPSIHGPGQYASPARMVSAGVPADQVRPGPVYPTANQLQHSFCYGFYRGNGNFTMLIPADELPRDLGIPALQGQEGMMVLPPPRAMPPGYAMNPPQMVQASVVNSLPVYNPSGTETREPGQISASQLQAAIDLIVASNPQYQFPGQEQPKPEKEYCDKWVHEGVCAFTQRGCKYKHIMPMDEDGQRKLGLNNGLPTWYKKLYGNQPVKFKFGADLSNRPQALPPTAGSSAVTSFRNGSRPLGTWREPRSSSATPSTSGGATSNAFSGRQSYGPIAPPAKQDSALPQRHAQNGNPYAMLDTLDDDMDDDMDEDDDDNNDDENAGARL